MKEQIIYLASIRSGEINYFTNDYNVTIHKQIYFKNQKKAIKWVAEYARARWDVEEFGKMPKDDKTAIRNYPWTESEGFEIEVIPLGEEIEAGSDTITEIGVDIQMGFKPYR